MRVQSIRTNNYQNQTNYLKNQPNFKCNFIERAVHIKPFKLPEVEAKLLELGCRIVEEAAQAEGVQRRLVVKNIQEESLYCNGCYAGLSAPIKYTLEELKHGLIASIQGNVLMNYYGDKSYNIPIFLNL